MFLHIFLTILHSDTMNDEQSSRVFSKKEKKEKHAIIYYCSTMCLQYGYQSL
jgi:hypothetical protein